MEWNCICVVVEPPLQVANLLLDEVRRVASGLERAGIDGVKWLRPHRYAAALALSEPGIWDENRDIDPLLLMLEKVARTCDEFAVQLGPVACEKVNNSYLIVSRLLSDPDERIGLLAQKVAENLADYGFVRAQGPRVVLGLLDMDLADRTMKLVSERDSPTAGWVLGGFCLARGIADKYLGLLEAERLRFFPLRRVGAAR